MVGTGYDEAKIKKAKKGRRAVRLRNHPKVYQCPPIESAQRFGGCLPRIEDVIRIPRIVADDGGWFVYKEH
jgi:hypothetical protein